MAFDWHDATRDVSDQHPHSSIALRQTLGPWLLFAVVLAWPFALHQVWGIDVGFGDGHPSVLFGNHELLTWEFIRPTAQRLAHTMDAAMPLGVLAVGAVTLRDE